MISKELEMVFAAAVREARIRRHELLTIEHILYALLDDELGSRILRSCRSNLLDLKKKLDAFFSEHLEALPEGRTKKIIQTVSFQRMLQRALLHAARNPTGAGRHGQDDADSNPHGRRVGHQHHQ